eukprot:CAMPEP_0114552966 /NCGR_PEP_ID=MMETSP0114-20121206/7404_1 /TAXON_ID=31324 /ORGANISM="Goniomonas sp, Strain m" /LENGTH=429 /DNA_ID=CAMNT_0001737873 /DNA_START=22 /DNA_END=1311 /DNA_ORIENTATION=+
MVGFGRQLVRAGFRASAVKGHVRHHSALSSNYDVTIVGGGGMGSSCAYFLSVYLPQARICVIEKDAAYAYASTGLSVGGCRQQFSTPENIQLSMFGSQFLRDLNKYLNVREDEPVTANFKEGGYLFLADDDHKESILRENHAVQKENGADNVLLTGAQLKERFPFMKTDDLQLGCLGLTKEGWFDPYSLLFALRNKAIANGVEYFSGHALGVQMDKNRVAGVQVSLNSGEAGLIKCGALVNAAGPFANELIEMAGLPSIPVRPRRRMVFVFHCKESFECPLTIDPTGFYYRRESAPGMYMTGLSPSADQDPDCTSVEDLVVDHTHFEDRIWPGLAERVPAFEDIKIKTAWAGFYDYNTIDQNAILGPHPDVPNLYLANGFSGHGIQQAAGVGRATAELVRSGKYETIDLSRFHLDRFEKGLPVFERNVV